MEENENIEEQQVNEQPQEEVVEQESPVSYKEDGTIVLDMNKLNEIEEAVQEEPNEALKELVSEVETPQEEQTVEEKVDDVIETANEAIQESQETGNPLPENIEKLVNFVNETGGSVEDYVRLNQNYDEMDNHTALQEYYKTTKPHLSAEEIEFMMDDQFSFDEEVDEDRDVKRKKLALKEQVAEAKAYLDGQKSKYYDEIKAKPIVNDEYQKAMDFFNRYNEEAEQNQKIAEERSNAFVERTDSVFNDGFEGFEYQVEDKTFKYNVKDASKVKETQSDINNFINNFIDSEGKITDAAGYHKALYAAMNADSLAQHFYEQGKADALKNSVAKTKNIDMTPRTSHGEVQANGMRVKALDLDTTPSFKFKKRK